MLLYNFYYFFSSFLSWYQSHLVFFDIEKCIWKEISAINFLKLLSYSHHVETINDEKWDKVYTDIIEKITKVSKLPISLKLSHYHSNLGYFIRQISHSPTRAIVLFNRFYNPDFDNLFLKNQFFIQIYLTYFNR